MSILKDFYGIDGTMDFNEFQKIFGGSYIYVPKLKPNLREIYQEVRKTHTRKAAIKHICEYYNVSKATLYRAIKGLN
ncbi:hypothetical protein [Campylobacter sp. RM12637]|uniref:hypothetical protein n=1 Tax=Campylobacter sp. RM12637 TaxID=2735734 RepID=UPI0030156A11|nr:helix-turn-helix domain-containing protein [Campylobacter sp. RM12637]